MFHVSIPGVAFRVHSAILLKSCRHHSIDASCFAAEKVAELGRMPTTGAFHHAEHVGESRRHSVLHVCVELN